MATTNPPSDEFIADIIETGARHGISPEHALLAALLDIDEIIATLGAVPLDENFGTVLVPGIFRA